MIKRENREKNGIPAPPQDYSIYRLTPVQAILGAAVGMTVGTVAVLIMFSSVIPALVCLPGFAFSGIMIIKRVGKKRRRRQLLLQFKELLESLSGSFLAGRNVYGAFEDALYDLESSHGSEAMMTGETAVIVEGLKNGKTIEELLLSLAERTGEEDIIDFADTFSACCRTGGDLKQTVAFSRDIICEKITVKMEIDAAVASGKNEMNILIFMPFVVVFMLRGLGTELVSGIYAVNIIVRLVATAMFAGAYFLGMKITDIKV